ncbi:MAG: transglycosylase SLT domain-containing protein [Kofleriaceae bacterium]
MFATTARVRRFDPVFDRYRGALPIEYVRALVERESNGLPAVRAGNAIGLMQIVPVVLTDYNKRHGTTYRGEHLTDPATNVAIGCELLHLIVESYRKHHPRIRTLQPDWDNLRFVELLTVGWNAGYSEAGGVGRVARYLEDLGAVDITIDQVSAHARLAGATKHLSNPKKIAWCKSVASLYQRERALQKHAALV